MDIMLIEVILWGWKHNLMGSKNSLLERAINYFGDSNNCGIYLSRETVAGQLDVTVDK